MTSRQGRSADRLTFWIVALPRILGMMGLILVVAGSILPAKAAEVRLALVIANSAYQHVPPLPNPVSDGRLVTRALKSAGFQTVILLENQDRIGMERALRNFADKAEHAQVAMIYYAGHGIESAGENYLIPIDAQLQRERDLEIEGVKLSTVVNMINGASKLKIIILDACRSPPSTLQRSVASRSISRGLARVEPDGDSLIVYSAKAGTTAADGSGVNSPFASALARRIVQPGREISLLFRQVRDDVLQATDHEQEPFTYGSLSGQEFYFIPPSASRSLGDRIDVEGEAWGLCRDAAGRGPCESYLASFAKGRFSALARVRLADLSSGVRSVPSAFPIRNEEVAALGVTISGLADRQGFVIRSVSPAGLAFGQLLVGDRIVQINSVKPDLNTSYSRQIADALTAGPLQLMIERGASKALIILRREN